MGDIVTVPEKKEFNENAFRGFVDTYEKSTIASIKLPIGRKQGEKVEGASNIKIQTHLSPLVFFQLAEDMKRVAVAPNENGLWQVDPTAISCTAHIYILHNLSSVTLPKDENGGMDVGFAVRLGDYLCQNEKYAQLFTQIYDLAEKECERFADTMNAFACAMLSQVNTNDFLQTPEVLDFIKEQASNSNGSQR